MQTLRTKSRGSLGPTQYVQKEEARSTRWLPSAPPSLLRVSDKEQLPGHQSVSAERGMLAAKF
jgi:hypothetical protein